MKHVIIAINIVLLGLIIILIWAYIDNNKYCLCGSQTVDSCPCPNHDYITIVEEYVEYKASSSYSWLEMCEKYKTDKNITFDCFE